MFFFIAIAVAIGVFVYFNPDKAKAIWAKIKEKVVGKDE